MDLADVTALVLTFNEESNVTEALQRLAWAREILVVDSFSTDDTVRIARQFPNTRIVQRRFDHFADQCNFGLGQITTEWTLSLDADYLCPHELPDEFRWLDGSCDAYAAKFRYCIFGRPLRAALYPPRLVLYRTSHAKYRRDGHAHRVHVTGKSGTLESQIWHDDRKPLRRWIAAQNNYAQLEVEKLIATPHQQLGWKDRLRKKIIFAPVLTLFYCLFYKRLILDGWRGVYYTAQRVYAELLLAIMLLDARLRPAAPSAEDESLQLPDWHVGATRQPKLPQQQENAAATASGSERRGNGS